MSYDLDDPQALDNHNSTTHNPAKCYYESEINCGVCGYCRGWIPDARYGKPLSTHVWKLVPRETPHDTAPSPERLGEPFTNVADPALFGVGPKCPNRGHPAGLHRHTEPCPICDGRGWIPRTATVPTETEFRDRLTCPSCGGYRAERASRPSEGEAGLRAALKDAVRILGGGHRGYVGDHWMRTVQVNETTIDRLRAALTTPVPADDRP